MIGRIGTGELLLILMIALLVFGPSRLPMIGKSIGKTVANFKRESCLREESDEPESKKA